MRYVRVCILLFHNRLSFCHEIAMSEVIDGSSQHSSRARAMCPSPSDRQRDSSGDKCRTLHRPGVRVNSHALGAACAKRTVTAGKDTKARTIRQGHAKSLRLTGTQTKKIIALLGWSVELAIRAKLPLSMSCSSLSTIAAETVIVVPQRTKRRPCPVRRGSLH